MTKVYLSLPQCSPVNKGEENYPALIAERLRATAADTVTVVNAPGEADIVILIESGRFKDHRYPKNLLNEPMIREFREKCLTINYEDNPAGLLPGIYANLERRKFCRMRHEAFCYLFPPRIPERYLVEPARLNQVKWLFTFRGAESHPIRQRLFMSRPLCTDPRGHIVRVDRWYNHTPAEVESYFNEIADSLFVLCPRGISTATHRMFEVMALGRVPVIISDEWHPIEGVNWQDCCIIVREQNISEIGDLLRERERDAPSMAVLARSEWLRMFSFDTRFRECFRRLSVLAARLSNEQLDYTEEWRSRNLRAQNGWLLSQRISRRLKGLCRLPTKKEMRQPIVRKLK